jgi:hypothetical protein
MRAQSITGLARDARGVALAQYIVVIGVVALVAIAGFRAFGVGLYSKVRTESDHVAALTPEQPGSNYCFAAGTLVATPDGLRPIEDIRRGDLVLSRDEASGALVARPVVRTFETPDAPLLELRIDGQIEPLRVTPGHVFFTSDRGWVEARSLLSGEGLVSSAGLELRAAGARKLDLQAPVYNLEVEGTHTYFVGSARAWVHNPALDCQGNVIPTEPSPAGGAATPGGAPPPSFTVSNVPEDCRSFGDVRPGSSVFWTGGQMDQAQAFAAANGLTTLEDTRCYAAIQQGVGGMPWEQAKPIFNETSQNYAAHASGVVHVVVPPGYNPYAPPPNGNNVWAQVEYPTLHSNLRVTQICYEIQAGPGSPASRVCIPN